MQDARNLPENFNSLLEIVEYFKDEKTAIDYLTFYRWKNNINCPRCRCEKVYNFSDGKRFKCASCRQQFTAKVGTIFEDSKIPLRKWFIAIYLITSHKKGISSHQLARDLKVTQKTGWFMLHRIRFGLSQGSFEMPLGTDSGEIEIDETFVGGKNKNRHKNKKVENSQGRSFKDKTPVLGMVERGGILKAMQIPDTKSETLQPIIEKEVITGSRVLTDEWWGYRRVSKAYQHHFVDHSAKQYCNGDVHTNTIEGFWSLFKRSIIGIYHSASSKHIQQYVDEAVFRYNTRGMSEGARVNLMLANSTGRLKYNTLIGRNYVKK